MNIFIELVSLSNLVNWLLANWPRGRAGKWGGEGVNSESPAGIGQILAYQEYFPELGGKI